MYMVAILAAFEGYPHDFKETILGISQTNLKSVIDGGQLSMFRCFRAFLTTGMAIRSAKRIRWAV
jgi:hypothetical protein